MISSYLVALTAAFAIVNCSPVADLVGDDPLPVVMWHGMGDSGASRGMQNLKNTIENEVPGVHVLALVIGDNAREDRYNSFLMDVNKQVDMACKMISDDPKISAAGKYNAVGFSQGSQFLRAVAHRCPTPQMNNLVSVGGQHQGVFGIPGCPGEEQALCDLMRHMLNMGAYLPTVQSTLVQAQYWHDPKNEQKYREKSLFIADINQEREMNQEYKDNFIKLNNFVMVKFNKDSAVYPTESQWFGFYHSGQSKTTYNMTESDLYKDDTIGLKTLDQQGKVHFLQLDTDHLQFTTQWFIDEIITPYFK